MKGMKGKMNNKGFTLVEVLATIVLLSVIMGVATFSVFNAINKSKEKSEEIFVDKIEKAIQSYVSYGSLKLGWYYGNPVTTFIKCRKTDSSGNCIDFLGNADSGIETKVYKVSGSNITNDSSFAMNESSFLNTIKDGKLINPKNKIDCLENLASIPKVTVFKDEDSVYYYYVDLRGTKTKCDINEKNGIISNIPKKLCSSLSLSDYNWDASKEVCVKS